MSNNKVVKGKGLTFRTKDIIEARYSLKGKEEDVFDMVLSKLEYDDNLRYCIEVKEFKEYYFDISNLYRDIKKTVKGMEGVGAHIYDEATESEIFYPWFSKIRYVDKQGWIEVDMHPEMKEILLEEKKKIFLQMKYKFRLSNEYSKRRYDMVNSFAYSGWRVDTVDDLCKKLKVPKSYMEKYSLFKANVLKKTDEEINRLTDLKIVSVEEKEKNKVVRIKTIITKKTNEELEELERQFKNRCINTNETSVSEPIRLQIEKMTENIDNIDLNVKKEIASHFGLSIRSIERYILINSKLIKELKELLDLNFLSVSTCYKYAQVLSEEKQLKEFNSLKRKVNKFKLKLIPELVEAIEQFKITYIQAEKYSEKNKEEQLLFYERKLGDKKKRGRKITAIDVDYTDVKEDDNSSDTDIANNGIAPINKIKEILSFDISDKQADVIYNNSNKNLEYIEYIFNEMIQLTTNGYKIKNAYSWLAEMVKPNVYNKPVIIENKSNKLKFDNFKGRDYDDDDLEKKLLGWDIDDDSLDSSDSSDDIIIDDTDSPDNVNNNESSTSLNELIELEKLKGSLELFLENKFGTVQYKTWLEPGIINLEKKDDIIILKYNNITNAKLCIEKVKKSYLSDIINFSKQIDNKISDVLLEVI